MEILLSCLVIFILSFIQSIYGVGVLVLGTPLLLILNYEIITIMKLLLPISILVSVSNVIIMNHNIKRIEKKKIYKILKYFLIFCFPAICLGIGVIKSQYFLNLNINILVASVILFSVIIKEKLKNFYLNKKIYSKISIMIIGLVHGLTNAGGTLLTIFFLKDGKDFEKTRFYVHFFYFILAFTQLIFLSLITESFHPLKGLTFSKIVSIILAVILSNLLKYKLNKKSGFFVSLLAIISAIFLILKNFFSA